MDKEEPKHEINSHQYLKELGKKERREANKDNKKIGDKQVFDYKTKKKATSY